jgi:hypothetical protein
VSAALDVLHGLVLDDGRRWGAAATAWQRLDAESVLEPSAEVPRLQWLGRPKGASKSTDLAGMVCAWLVEQAPATSEGFAVAADEEQANRLLDKARGFIARTSELQSVLRVEAKRIVNLRSGARVQALAADVAGSEGLLTPFVVVDELPNWSSTSSARAMWTSIFSAVPKWPGMRLVVIGHAGDPAHWSYSILERARVSERWRVHEVPGPLEWISAGDLEEQRAMLLPSQFRRRHLNEWCAAEDRLTTVDDVRACVRHSGVLAPRAGVSYVVSLDVGLTNDRTVATVAHLDGEVVVVDRQEVWQGSRSSPVVLGDVEDWLGVACRSYNRAPLVFDPFQAVHVAQRLRGSGVRVLEFTFSQSSIGRLAVTMFRMLRDRQVALPDDAELIGELTSVRLVEKQPGVYRIDHDSNSHDDRVISLALAAQHLLERPARRTLSYRGTDRDHGGPRRLGAGGSDAVVDVPSSAEGYALLRRAGYGGSSSVGGLL